MEVKDVPKRDPGPSIKDKRLYEKLRDEGNSKSKSARIANAAARSSRARVAQRGGSSACYDAWTKPELLNRAKTIGIKGRSTMGKKELVVAVRQR